MVFPVYILSVIFNGESKTAWNLGTTNLQLIGIVETLGVTTGCILPIGHSVQLP